MNKVFEDNVFYEKLARWGEKNEVTPDNADLEKEAVSYFESLGIQPKRAVELWEELIGYWKNEKSSVEKKIWALRRGFLPDKISLFKLTEDNFSDYLSDYNYFIMHPLNNHFAFWINDKLTLKYMLQKPLCINKEKGIYMDLMPEYYLYIENDGHYSYLMDAPDNIARDESFLYNLLKEKLILALKPSRGEGGCGFYKLEYLDDTIILNGNKLSMDEWDDFKDKLSGYIVTEYVMQHHELAEICPTSACTLRVVTCKTNRHYDGGKTEVLISYARFGTEKSKNTSNLSAGGVGVKFDFDTGEYADCMYRKGVLKDGEDFKVYAHPDNGISLKGKKLPNWELVRDSVFAVCDCLSSLDYLGFDIIVTETGVKICEINSLPGIDCEQLLEGPLMKHRIGAAFFNEKFNNRIKQ